MEQGQRLNRIRVQGEGHVIISVLDRIYAIFEEVEKKEREEYQAEVVAKQVESFSSLHRLYENYAKNYGQYIIL